MEYIVRSLLNALTFVKEFLGDWVNLLGHQRAAFQILTDLFTPQTVTQDETRRRIISWYIRFDLFAGHMSGGELNLSRDWFAACQEHYHRQARDRPDDIGARLEDFFSTSRLLSADMALLFAGKKSETITDQDFAERAGDLIGQCAKFKETIETAFADPSNYVKSFTNPPSLGDDSITDYEDPNSLFAGDLFSMNYVLIDFWAMDLMFKHQLTMAQQQPPSAEMAQLAIKQCKMFEAVEHGDQGEAAAILGCQASLGMASLFLPKDQKHTNWCRRKFALIEQHG